MTKKMEKIGIYIYGIVPNFYGAEHFRSLEKAGVYAIPLQNISAIVSEREMTTINFSDRKSMAQQMMLHRKTIEEVANMGFPMILPMRLGTFVRVKEEVLTILAKGYDLFIKSFNKIENTTEIDLTVTWSDFDGILKEISSHPEIATLGNRGMTSKDALSFTDQVKTGMLVREKLNEKNKKVELKILDVLSSFSLNIKLNDVTSDQMVTNSAFLINTHKKDKFLKIIDQLEEDYNEKLNFKIIGPMPCYSFYTIEVKELNPENIAFAKKELGLGEEASESVIKRAYLDFARLYHPDAYPNGDGERFKRIIKAYHTLLEYNIALHQTSEVEYMPMIEDKANQKMYLIKMID